MSNQAVLLDVNLEDFYDDSNFVNIDEAFEFFSTEQIFKDRDLGIDEIKTGLTGRRNDGGIDGLYIFLDDELIFDETDLDDKEINSNPLIELFVFQYKNSTRIEELVLDRFLGSVDYLFQLDQDYEDLGDVFNSEVIEKIKLFHSCWREASPKHPEIKVNYLHVCKGNKKRTLGPQNKNEAYVNKKERLIDKVKRVSGTISDVGFKLYDAKNLLDLYRKQPDYSSEIKLNENPIAIDYENANDDSSEETEQGGYIASVNLTDYYDFLCDEDGVLRKHLFESNIRDYQKNTQVNKAIANTVEDEFEFDFWWLNNGVTIIAEEGTLTGKKIHLDNVQIVNGLQTSQTIYNVLSESDDLAEDNRSVFLKIIITSDKEAIDSIIKSTNSQNYVHPSLFKATDSIQRDIEEHLLNNNLYYDRRKNYYKNQGKPIRKIISIKYMAQCIKTIVEKNPSKARVSPASLTKKEKHYNRIFHKSRSLDVYLNSVLIMKGVEEFFKKEFTPNGSVEENIARNFKFHIARIIPSLILENHRYNDRKIENFNFDAVDDEVYNKAIYLLKLIIRTYREENEQQNLINIAKNISFSNLITDYLKDYFSDSEN